MISMWVSTIRRSHDQQHHPQTLSSVIVLCWLMIGSALTSVESQRNLRQYCSMRGFIKIYGVRIVRPKNTFWAIPENFGNTYSLACKIQRAFQKNLLSVRPQCFRASRNFFKKKLVNVNLSKNVNLETKFYSFLQF